MMMVVVIDVGRTVSANVSSSSLQGSYVLGHGCSYTCLGVLA